MRLAGRMARLGTETAFDVLIKARSLEAQGKDVIHLEIGEPDFDTPSNIVDAAVKALREGHTHYTPSPGIPELRQAIAEEIASTRGIEVDPDEVVVTPGAKPIMFFALLALAEEGDEVIYPDPGFPIYQSVINFVGAKPVPLPLREELGFRFDMDELRAKVNSHTKMLIINSPHNPTGGVLSEDDLKTIADLAKDSGFMILSDEVYSRIIYEGKHASIASLPGMKELTIILEGFSKTYAMTGWRLGYGVMPVELAGQISRLMTNSNSCTAAFTQWAGIEALRGPQDASEEMVEAFRERRDAVVAGLNGIPGIRCFLPKGAFYVFPNVEGVGMDGDRFADHLLNEAGVALLSGTAFGACGEGFLRISYANSMENLKRAVARISDVVGRIG